MFAVKFRRRAKERSRDTVNRGAGEPFQTPYVSRTSRSAPDPDQRLTHALNPAYPSVFMPLPNQWDWERARMAQVS